MVSAPRSSDHLLRVLVFGADSFDVHTHVRALLGQIPAVGHYVAFAPTMMYVCARLRTERIRTSISLFMTAELVSCHADGAVS